MAIQGFTSVPQADGQDRYICNTCGGRDMNLNYLTRHVNSSVHQRNLLSIARGQNQASQSTLVGGQPDQITQGDLGSNRFQASIIEEGDAGIQRGQQARDYSRRDTVMNDGEDLFIPRSSPEDHAMPYQAPPLEMNDQTGMGFGGVDNSSDDSSSLQPMAVGQFDLEKWNMVENFSFVNDYVVLPGNAQNNFDVESDEGLNPNDLWYPFPAKEYLIAAMMLGHLHYLLPRNMYHLMRLILNLCFLNLPHWATIRRRRQKIREMLDIKLLENVSVLNNKCFSLDLKDIIAHEISNPHITTQAICLTFLWKASRGCK
ncbi:hypothetical protein PGTUg99_005834 [Puccinia graminis f. sp. tritici]|uniref:C2H2-type domain-containing protein n=1 Tax=Puccinia graminis f. sp. tritici TaxID=56615 RepID=A0A5B0QHK8_PUCGR|nr:hypothetical protein PGTUg99_005834 [Puccinia graminis f. sp. tritici]